MFELLRINTYCSYVILKLMEVCIIIFRLIKREFLKNFMESRSWLWKEKTCWSHEEKLHSKKKRTISDGVLKHKIVIELELTKGLLTQYPNLGQRYKKKRIFIGKGACVYSDLQ